MEIIFEFRNEYSSFISLGIVFLDLFDLVSFSYDSNTISFYTKNKQLIQNYNEFCKYQNKIR